MSAPNQPVPATRVPRPDPGPLRLRMADRPLPARLEGVWWPRSRDLAEEVADLVDRIPAPRFGHIIRVLVSRADWDAHPGHVLVADGYLKVCYLPDGDDCHLIRLTTSDRSLLPLLVIPPDFTRDQGDAALAAAATYGDTRSGSALVDAVRREWAGDTRRGADGRGQSTGETRVTWWSPDATLPAARPRR